MRCGNRIYKGVEIPFTAVVKTSPKGREYYLTGINDNMAILIFIDNSEVIRVSVETYNRY